MSVGRPEPAEAARAKKALRDPYSVGGRGSSLEANLAHDVLALVARLDTLRQERDGWGMDIGDRRATELLAAVKGSDWWFDGWDVFHKPAGTNLDQIVIPRGPTFHESQQVPDAVLELVVVAVNRLRAALPEGQS